MPRILVLATLGAIGCSSLPSPDEEPAIARVAPTGVSDADAWRLFDRSISSTYTPKRDVVIELGRDRAVAGMKVFGAAPYTIVVEGKRFPLGALAPGWHAFSWTPITRRAVTIRFEPTGAAGAIPELELWGIDDDPHEQTYASTTTAATIEPGDCTTFAVDIAQPATQFRHVRLAYTAEGVFRTFSLRRTINRGSPVGGYWLTGQASRRELFEEIDPTTLVRGSNSVQLCVPDSATRAVDVSALRIVGELDRGVALAERATVGTADAPQLVDGDPNTGLAVAANTPIELGFDRLVAPDAVLARGAGNAIPRIVCEAATGANAQLAARTEGGAIRVDGAAHACAALVLTFDANVFLDDLAVIGSGAAERVDWPHLVVTSAREHFGDAAWVSGFAARPAAMTGPVRLAIRGEEGPSLRGDFGTLLVRNDDARWSVDLDARWPDGTRTSHTLVLDGDARAELAAARDGTPTASTTALEARYGRAGASITARVTAGAAKSLRLGTHVGLELPPGALAKRTELTARQLAEGTRPPLDAGMIDVTAPKGRGYDFGPHDARLATKASVELPFDPRLIPSEMSADDVHTYVYDDRARRWRELPRTALDVGKQVVHSSTEQLATMVNAVLALPTNPAPLAFDPTSLSSVAAASPAANIDLIEPPVPTSSGDAVTSLPLEIPAGRGAYSPELAIRYSSAGGNGWLGVGWDLGVSNIEIDTRWGVPTYADTEEPRYMMDGGELVPTLEVEGPTCPSGPPGRRYHARVEGRFSHILRCGATPADFYFQVYDRSGTKFIYGSDVAGNTGNPNVLSLRPRPCATAPCGNGIAQWNLRKVIDTYGNTTTYSYQVDSITGGEPSREVFPQTIVYTSHASKPAHYTVEFLLDAGTRADKVISGRGGYKAVTRKLLRAVKVKLDTTLIRQYVLTYAPGQFQKSTLQSVRVYGTGSCNTGLDAFVLPSCSANGMLDEHTFEYFTDETKFEAPAAWAITGDPAPAQGVLSRGDSKGLAASVSVRAGIKDPSGTIGVHQSRGANVSRSSRTEKYGFYDVDGDGLPDHLLAPGGPPVLLANRSATTMPPAFGPGVAVTGIDVLGRERSSSWGTSAEVGIDASAFGASLSGGFSNATSRSNRIVSDLNGDGYLDVLTKTQAWFSKPCASGICFTPGAFPASLAINPGADPLLGPFALEIEERLVMADPVVQWTAPYKGTITIGGTVSLASATPLDGVKVDLTRGDLLLGSWVLGSTSAPLTINVPNLVVIPGDRFYVRVSSAGQAGNTDTALRDEVSAALDVRYTTAFYSPTSTTTVPMSPANMREPTHHLTTRFLHADELRVTAPYFIAPVEGVLHVHGGFQKTNSTADMRICLQHYSATTVVTDVKCATTDLMYTTRLEAASSSGSSPDVDVAVTVQAGDKLVLRSESDWSNDPNSIRFVPSTSFKYDSACIPNDVGDGCAMTSDADRLAEIPLDPSQMGFFVAPVTPPEPPGAVPMALYQPATARFIIDPFPNPFGTLPLDIAVRVSGTASTKNTLVTFACATAMCSVPSLPETPAGSWLTIEIMAAPSSFPVNPVYIPVKANSVTYQAPLTFRKRTRPPLDNRSPFVGGYRGWRTALWNEAKPFAPEAFLGMLGDLEEICDGIDLHSEACAERLVGFGITAFAPVPAFGGVPFSSAPSAPAYRGRGSPAFVTQGPGTSRMNVGRLGQLGPPEAGVPSLGAGGLFDSDYVRLSGTRSSYLTEGFDILPVINYASLEGTTSRSFTRTTTDVMDLTGDGIADVIAGGRLIKGTLGAPVSPAIDVPFDDGFRRASGVDYSFDLSSRPTAPQTSGGGRTVVQLPLGIEEPDWIYGESKGMAVGRSQLTQDLVDLNGDGLQDLVKRAVNMISVRYNLGTSFGAWETYGSVSGELATTKIDGFQLFEDADSVGELDSTGDALSHDTTLTQNTTSSLNLIVASYTKMTRTTSSRTTRQLADLNGDGLPDLLLKRADEPFIRVQYNLGGGFSAPTQWDAGSWGTLEMAPSFAGKFNPLVATVAAPDVLAGTSSQVGTTHTGGFNIPLYDDGVASVSLGGSLAYSTDVDTYELSLVDVTGDGAPDHVFRRGKQLDSYQSGNTFVKRNKAAGLANLLRVIHRPLGGTITLAYGTAGNTFDMPRQRTVLTRIEVDDGVTLPATTEPLFASPNVVTTVRYANGKYDRDEREFLGFGRVTVLRADGSSIQQTYHTSTYALHGSLTSEVHRDAANAVFSTRDLNYQVLDVLREGDVVVPLLSTCMQKPGVGIESCTPRHPVLVRETETTVDGASKVQVSEDLTRDRFGNVLTSKDAADGATIADDLLTTVAYENRQSTWLLGLPISIETRDATANLLRRRTGTYNAEGKLATLGIDTGAGTATSTFGYDVFGNATSIISPPNADGETQTINVAFDTSVATYPITITDSFGISSSSTYDLKFGVPLTETDANGTQIVRTYDAFGRLATVRGPYDGTNPTLTLAYFQSELPARATTVSRSSAPSDYTGALPPAFTTVTVVDGEARTIQTRVSSAVDAANGMTTSGLVQRDALGRTTRTYQPFFTAGASTAYIVPPTAAPPFTSTAYDVRGRVSQVTYPDGSMEKTTYAIEVAPSGALLYRTRVLDADSHPIEQYVDESDRMLCYVEHPDGTTSAVTTYDYLGTGELSKIVDAEGNVTKIAYDQRGLRTSYEGADTGTIVERYDLAGNRIARIDANHAAAGTEVRYHYDRDRLESIQYPTKPAVTFTYGAPAAPSFGAGRLVRRTDETGSTDFTYGALGEVRRSVRRVHPFDDAADQVFATATTSDTLGRLLGITYPDGETITNTYGLGGLTTVVGAGNGWTRNYATGIRYDVFGNRTRLVYGNNAVSTWTFDPLTVRLKTIATTLGAKKLQELGFTYTPGGNPSQLQNVLAPLTASSGNAPGASTVTFTYDGVDRMLTATGTAQLGATSTTTYNLAFSYSTSHKLVQKNRGHQIDGVAQPATSLANTYLYTTRPHLPSKVGAIDILYDASGNATSRIGAGLNQGLTWDDDNRLVQVDALRSSYDASGLRTVRWDTDSGQQTIFASAFYDLELGAEGIKHVFAGELRIASVFGAFGNVESPPAPTVATRPYYIHSDHLGSTAVVTTQAGTVHQSVEYFADGESWIDRAPTSSNDGLLFNGKPFDPQTGFYDYGQRFYDPRTSLWLGIDPAMLGVEKVVGNPKVMSPLAYGAHSPMRFMDPDGREATTDRAKAMHALANMAGIYPGNDFNWDTASELGIDEAMARARIVMEDNCSTTTCKMRARGGLDGLVGTLGEAATAYGDSVTWGASAMLREEAGYGDTIDTESGAYELVEMLSGTGKVKGGKFGAQNTRTRLGKLRGSPTGRGRVPLSKRDAVRDFKKAPRQAKQKAQQYKCAGCGKKINLKNAHGHHKKRWADGGRSVSRNHAEACKTCHKKLHSKKVYYLPPFDKK